MSASGKQRHSNDHYVELLDWADDRMTGRDLNNGHQSKHSPYVPPVSAVCLNKLSNGFRNLPTLANPCTPVRFRYSPPLLFNGLNGFAVSPKGASKEFAYFSSHLTHRAGWDAGMKTHLARLLPGTLIAVGLRGGIEPPTRGFSIHCSTPELPGHGRAGKPRSGRCLLMSPGGLSRGETAKNQCRVSGRRAFRFGVFFTEHFVLGRARHSCR